MRRALPWLTVGLLVLGVSAGAGLGISGQSSTPVTPSATQQIDRIVAATLRAQTARFTYSDTTASSNRLLRSTDEGSGQIDFGHDTMRADERDRARFAKARSYMLRKDDQMACKNMRCRKRFEIAGIQTVAFL